MPIITRLVSQERHPDISSVYLDGVFAFGLKIDDVNKFGLKVGLDVDHEFAEELAGRSTASKYYNKAINLISFRRRSVLEIEQYLRKQELSEDAIKQIISHLVSDGILDDVAFAQAWAADRQLLRPRSRRILYLELQKKGIDKDIIKDVLDGIDPELEINQIITLINSKSKSSQYSDKQKLMAYLSRKGYSYANIKLAFDQYESSKDDCL